MAEKVLLSIIVIALTYIYCKPAPLMNEATKPILSDKDTYSEALLPSRLAQQPIRIKVRQPVRTIASVAEPEAALDVVVPAEDYRSERDHEADSPFVEPGISLEDLQRARAH